MKLGFAGWDLYNFIIEEIILPIIVSANLYLQCLVDYTYVHYCNCMNVKGHTMFVRQFSTCMVAGWHTNRVNLVLKLYCI